MDVASKVKNTDKIVEAMDDVLKSGKDSIKNNKFEFQYFNKKKLNDFNNKSIVGGVPKCMKQTGNKECQKKYMSIDRLSDILTKIHE